jgi:hypothetical protein
MCPVMLALDHRASDGYIKGLHYNGRLFLQTYYLLGFWRVERRSLPCPQRIIDGCMDHYIGAPPDPPPQNQPKFEAGTGLPMLIVAPRVCVASRITCVRCDSG